MFKHASVPFVLRFCPDMSADSGTARVMMPHSYLERLPAGVSGRAAAVAAAGHRPGGEPREEPNPAGAAGRGEQQPRRDRRASRRRANVIHIP